jgi:outer membrane protein assembly factor BamB
MLSTFFILTNCFLTIFLADQPDDWRQFRGAGGASVASTAVPIQWTDTQNVAWKIELPGKGASSPIVIGQQVVVTSSSGLNQEEIFIQAFDVVTGQANWTRKFIATGSSICHELTANAAPTPITDGKYLYAFFSSNDLVCLDLQGNLIWYRGLGLDYPNACNDFGMSSSPVVHAGVLVVQVECPGDSFAMGLNASDGSTRWTLPRRKQGIWSSPLLISNPVAEPLVLLQGKQEIDLVELNTGKTVASYPGECSSISSAATEGNRLYVPINGTTAFRVNTDGSLQELWNSPGLRPHSASSVLFDQRIFALNATGVLMTFKQADGSAAEKVRVAEPRTVWATPVIAGNHAYIFSQTGKSRIVKVTGGLQVIHEYDFGPDECFLGSPAVAEQAMYVRSHRHLWKFALPESQPEQ